MIQRTLASALRKLSRTYPVVTLTGPRQSGKTTLAKAAFPRHSYVNLEDPQQRDFASGDPRGFLDQFPSRVILDEVQRVPDLFSYVQTIADNEDRPGRFILTGSQNFLLMDKVSQSLAGRAAICHLLPFSRSELVGRAPLSLERIGKTVPRGEARTLPDLMDVMFCGFYPRIHDAGIAPQDWLADYYHTYVERDVRSIINVGDLEAFGRFVRMCAGRNGQLLNLSSLASDCGITHTTARRWVSVLETSFLITLLRPHFRNFSKRLVKSPKLYFLDTGLLCYLLRIRSAEELRTHSARGSIFESLVLAELLKNFYHHREEPALYFWRDSHGHEIDILIDRGEVLIPIEVKSSRTFNSEFLREIKYWQGLAGPTSGSAALVYGGNESYSRSSVAVYSWRVL